NPVNGVPACVTPSCLMGQSYFGQFTYGATIVAAGNQHLSTVDQFLVDANNGPLPQVVFVEPASAEGLDEHPADVGSGAVDIQTGAKFVASLINGLMNSPS